MKKYYLPYGEAERLIWLYNLNTEVQSIGLSIGLTQDEIDDIAAALLAGSYVMNCISIIRPASEGFTSYKDLLFEGEIGSPLGTLPVMPTLPVAPASVAAGIFKRIAPMVQRIKSHAGYNEALGEKLGIIGSERIIDEENAKPKVKVLHSNSGEVALDFVKSVFVGVIVYGGVYTKIAGADEAVMKWTEIGRATSSPYKDKRSNTSLKPEVRHYKMRFMIKDEPIGLDSDIITVIASVGN